MYSAYKLGKFFEKTLVSIIGYSEFLYNPKSFLNYEMIERKMDFEKIKIKKRIYYALRKLEKKGFIKIVKLTNEKFNIDFTQKAIKYLKIKKEITYKKLNMEKELFF